MTDIRLEDEAAAYADENWGSYFDSCVSDYKEAWCAAHEDYMEGGTE